MAKKLENEMKYLESKHTLDLPVGHISVVQLKIKHKSESKLEYSAIEKYVQLHSSTVIYVCLDELLIIVYHKTPTTINRELLQIIQAFGIPEDIKWIATENPTESLMYISWRMNCLLRQNLLNRLGLEESVCTNTELKREIEGYTDLPKEERFGKFVKHRKSKGIVTFSEQFDSRIINKFSKFIFGI